MLCVQLNSKHVIERHRTAAGCLLECLNVSLTLRGLALIDVGEALRELAEVKDALDMEVKQNFIDPLQNLHEKDLKEIQVPESTNSVL